MRKKRRTLGSAAPKNVDRHGAEELRLFIDNDEPLYRQKQALEVTVAKHACRGNFSATKAAKAFQYVADAGAKKYDKEFGSARGLSPRFGPRKKNKESGDMIFSKPTRTAVARNLAAEFTRNMRECVRKGANSAGCNDLSPGAVKLLQSCKRK